jgi:ribosomal protein S27AE
MLNIDAIVPRKAERMSYTTHFPKAAYERPPCSTCGTTMMLARIETEIQENKKRTFECGVCNRTEAIVMRYK